MDSMRIRWLAVLLMALAMLAVTACGSGDKAAPTTPTPAATAESVAQHEDEALVRSSSSVASAMTFTATLHADVDTNGKTITEDGTFAFRAPSTTYMRIDVLGQETELLLDLPDEYIKIPGKGWYSIGDAIVNKDTYAEYAKNHGPVDYVGVLNSLKTSRHLPDDSIDGVTYSHYAGTFSLGDAIGSVPQDLFQPGMTDAIKQVAPMDGDIEVWLDSATGLPHRVLMTETMSLAGSNLTVHMTMDYAGWNEPVDIPPAPQDARPYSELTGGLTLQDSAYVVQSSSWLDALSKHVQAFLADLPNDPSARLTSQQQSNFDPYVEDLRGDIRAFAGLKVTPRFQGSHAKLADAVDLLGGALDEFDRDLADSRLDNETQLEDAFSRAASLVQEGAKLLQSEVPQTGQD